MLWAADSNGRLASLADHSSTRAAPGPGAGRQRVLRETAGPQAIAVVRALLRSISQTKLAGSTSYRIAQTDGFPAHVEVDAIPAVSPDDGSFAGYIGSVHLLGGPLAENAPVHDDLARIVLLDAIADHVIQARALAVRADDRHLVKVLDLALLSIGDRLVQTDVA